MFVKCEGKLLETMQTDQGSFKYCERFGKFETQKVSRS